MTTFTLERVRGAVIERDIGTGAMRCRICGAIWGHLPHWDHTEPHAEHCLLYKAPSSCTPLENVSARLDTIEQAVARHEAHLARIEKEK